MIAPVEFSGSQPTEPARGSPSGRAKQQPAELLRVTVIADCLLAWRQTRFSVIDARERAVVPLRSRRLQAPDHRSVRENGIRLSLRANERGKEEVTKTAERQDKVGSDEGAAPQGDLYGKLADIRRALFADTTLDGAEHALDAVGEALDLVWVWWTPDAARPYHCPRAEVFSRNRGWPSEIMQLWRENRLTLNSPFHIRARFEHLPFVTRPDTRAQSHGAAGYSRLNKLVAQLGITAMLHVPVHLSKGQIGLVNWGGAHPPWELGAVLPEISAELLLIGHLFMRNYNAELGQGKSSSEDRQRLTPREWDCLRMLAQGYREAEVAELLNISKSTLRFHIENVVRKFDCKTRTQAIAIVAQLGLLGPIGK
jgi:DNA-binding CsgD family transcriptional regulator